MKPLLWVLAFACLHPVTHSAAEPKGFLVFEVSRSPWGKGPQGESEIESKFKIPVTKEFISNFKSSPSQHGRGSALWCSGGNLKPNDKNEDEGEARSQRPSTSFVWWIQPGNLGTDHRWAIHMWCQAWEIIKGEQYFSRNPSVTQWVVIRSLEELDMRYDVSYAGKDLNGINVSFRARYMTAKEMRSGSPVPTIPVKRTDQSVLFSGDDLSNVPVELGAGFQEN